MESRSVTDFYTEIVLPRLQERLDRAFPEFGWKPDRLGWVATNEEHTHARLGVRADRVVAHGPAPRGFLIFGGEQMLWTAYVNGGVVPRGVDFVRAVKTIGERAAVDIASLDREEPRDARTEILRDFFELCRQELIGERGARARAYLEGRGLPAVMIEASRLGLVPVLKQTHQVLTRAGHDEVAIADAGVLADSRWPGRLCGAWRDERERVRTLWARALDPTPEPGSKYLYLRGAPRTGLPPYGLSEVLARPISERRDLVLVEGLLDVHHFRAREVPSVAALGGTSASPETFERLARLRFERVTICLDRDGPGRAAAARIVEQAARAKSGPAILVLDPEHLAQSKDPDEFLARHGPEAWHETLARRECGITWRAHELLETAGPTSPPDVRRAALARVGRWLGTLPPRFSLEQEDAVRTVAEACGYSPAAVERAFRARFWQEKSPQLNPTRGGVVEIARDLS
ncbi:MAG: toprim domain-containing protein [Gaiellaceae bacterium]